jgi:cell division protease FtsH
LFSSTKSTRWVGAGVAGGGGAAGAGWVPARAPRHHGFGRRSSGSSPPAPAAPPPQTQVAKGRDSRLRSVGNDEREQTLNQLLTELDGFETDKDNVVICIAATNRWGLGARPTTRPRPGRRRLRRCVAPERRAEAPAPVSPSHARAVPRSPALQNLQRPDVLDAALLRPGRFDRRVPVERPDRLGREQILRVHLQRRGLPLAPDVTPSAIASMTTGFTGADLANLVNEAALLAGRRNKSVVGAEEFDVAVLRAVAGIEKKRSLLAGLEKDVVARHEVGSGRGLRGLGLRLR